MLFTRAALLTAVIAPSLIALPESAGAAATVPPAEVITEDPFTNDPDLTHQLASALREAEARALNNPAAYAQPYVDQAGTVHVPVADPAAQAEAGQAIPVPPAGQAPDDGTDDMSAVPPPDTTDKDIAPPATPPQSASAPLPPKDPKRSAITGPMEWIDPATRVVPYSWHRLEEIADEVLTLTPDVLPDADKVQSSTIDPETNRVVVETTAATDALRNALAVRYGTGAVALLVIPDLGLPDATGRQNDTSSGGGFYGGARIVTNVGNCTSGFSWRVGSAQEQAVGRSRQPARSR
ncbi:hypothetical protein ACIBHY_28615 [Nonomuraea sp. NPDC050547]|uniref:hypothetical protein n=1 Tax=Nonomuraea sp. NPDC050547 TaxID=3364368 RepID=UPI00379C68A2